MNTLQEQDKKTYLFEAAPIPSAVAQLAIPTILSSLVMVLYNLADTYFVGMLNDPVQNAAVTLAAPVLLAFNAVNNLFGVGSSSLMSRSLGCKDYDMVSRSSAFGFYCALFSGILFSILCASCNSPLLTLLGADDTTRDATQAYMLWTVYFGAAPSILNVVLAYLVRAEGSAVHASVGTMSGCFLNIILDPIFIMPWGLGMGAAGAGLATFISNCVACLYFLVLIAVRRGIPAAMQNLLNVTGMTILNNFTSAYQAEAIAAMGIAQKINMLPMYVSLGLSQGVMPLISYTYSSGNDKRMKDSVSFTGVASVIIIAVVSVVYFIFPGFFISLFMDSDVIVNYGSHFLRGMSIAGPFMCIDFLAVGVFQAVGMGREALIFAILRKIVLEIPALWILNILFPLYGLAYAQSVAEFVLSIVAIVVMSRLFKCLARQRQE